MKHEKISLKWKIFLYLLAFAGIILIVLWICQTVYLENMYKYIKERDLSTAVAKLEKAAGEEEPGDSFQQIAEENELSLKIVTDEGKELYAEQFVPVSAIENLTREQLRMYYREVKRNGGTMEFSSGDEWKKDKDIRNKKQEDKAKDPGREISGEPYASHVPMLNPYQDGLVQPPVPPSGDAIQSDEEAAPDVQERPIEEHLLRSMQGGQESMVSASIVDIQGKSCLMLVSIKLTPVEATVTTLRIQLVYISIIIVALAFLLAFIISRSISGSIIKVNESAKELAHGNFEVTFGEKDYKEIGQLSDTLNYAAKELAKTEALQRELLANVSHDLRTPLTMIIAYSEVMRDLPGENTPENVQVVIEEAQRLTNLVNDMLDVSKLQAGVLQIDKHVYNLTDSVERVMERYVKLKEQDNYQIHFLCKEHVSVCADEYKIYQVLYNLINNAINYTGEDKQVTVEQIVKDGRVRIEVRDTGSGIPPEELDNVWERYYKVDKVHKRAIQGTGLGLSICKNILRLHQAEYGVESEAGCGSVFWFELEVVSEDDV